MGCTVRCQTSRHGWWYALQSAESLEARRAQGIGALEVVQHQLLVLSWLQDVDQIERHVGTLIASMLEAGISLRCSRLVRTLPRHRRGPLESPRQGRRWYDPVPPWRGSWRR